MRIDKKVIIYILLFIFSLTFLYIFISAGFYVSLTYKPYYEFNETIQSANNKVLFTTNDDDEIIVACKKDKYININLLPHDDKSLKTLMSIEMTDDIYLNSLQCNGNYYYLYFNKFKSVYKIDLNSKKYDIYKNIPDGLVTINKFDDQFYKYDNNNIYLLTYNDSNFIETLIYHHNENNPIIYNRFYFLSKDCYVLSGNATMNFYNKGLCVDSLEYKLSYCYNDYMYTISNVSNKKIEVNINNCNNDKTTFIVNHCKNIKADTMIVKGDYIYLLSKDEMTKICISRKKRQEKMVISGYDDLYYSLENVIIINEKLMYLPMYKEENDDNESYHKLTLYRYKIK